MLRKAGFVEVLVEGTNSGKHSVLASNLLSYVACFLANLGVV